MGNCIAMFGLKGYKRGWRFIWPAKPVKGSKLRFNSWERFWLRYFHWFWECCALIIYARDMFLLRHYICFSPVPLHLFSWKEEICPKSGNLTLLFHFFSLNPNFGFVFGPECPIQSCKGLLFIFDWKLTRCPSLWNNHHLLIVIAKQKPKAWFFQWCIQRTAAWIFWTKTKASALG